MDRCFEGHWNKGNMEGGKTAFDRGHVADARHIDAECNRDCRDEGYAGERGRNRSSEPRKHPDYGHGDGDEDYLVVEVVVEDQLSILQMRTQASL